MELVVLLMLFLSQKRK